MRPFGFRILAGDLPVALDINTTTGFTASPPTRTHAPSMTAPVTAVPAAAEPAAAAAAAAEPAVAAQEPAPAAETQPAGEESQAAAVTLCLPTLTCACARLPRLPVQRLT